MTYETMDWEAEAKRIQRAFNIKYSCIWESRGTPRTSYLVPRPDPSGFPSVGILLLNLSYTNYNDGLEIHASLFKPGVVGTSISIRNGKAFCSSDHTYSHKLARGLFHLSLLTPEVEAALGITVTAHTKLEWTLEYAGRVEG